MPATMGKRTRARRDGDDPEPTLGNRLEYLGLRGLAFLLLCTDVRGAARIASALSGLVGLLDRRHRLIAQDNLRRAYAGALSEEEVRATVARVYRRLGVTAAEFVHGPRRIRGRAARRWFRVEGLEEVRRVAGDRPAILLSAHLGNWEHLVPAARSAGVDLVPVARPLDNPLLDRWVAGIRSRTGNLPVSKHGALRGLLRTLREGKWVGMIVDQNGGRHGRLSTFFGRPCSTQGGGVALARRQGLPFAVGRIERVRVGVHRLVFGPPVLVRDDDEAEREAVDEMNRQIEAAVRRRPADWMWLHRRWRIKADWGFPVEPTEGRKRKP